VKQFLGKDDFHGRIIIFSFRYHLVCGRAAEADTLPQAVLLPVSQVQVGRHHHFGRQGKTPGFSEYLRTRICFHPSNK
jgi:hypothetical protein